MRSNNISYTKAIIRDMTIPRINKSSSRSNSARWKSRALNKRGWVEFGLTDK